MTHPASLSTVTPHGVYGRQVGCGKACECPTYRDHLLSINISPSARPTTTKGAVVAMENQQWDSKQPDRAAYRRLRKEGLQPPSIAGSAHLEREADHPLEVESGKIMTKTQVEQITTLRAGGEL